MGANELGSLIWRERELLETLLFKLEVEQLLMTTGMTQWSGRASGEINMVTSQLRQVGLTRTLEVEALSKEWGAPEESTLRQLIAVAPTAVWKEILEAHLLALTNLTRKIQGVKEVNEGFLRSAMRSTTETLAKSGSLTNLYNARGQINSADSIVRFLDKEI